MKLFVYTKTPWTTPCDSNPFNYPLLTKMILIMSRIFKKCSKWKNRQNQVQSPPNSGNVIKMAWRRHFRQQFIPLKFQDKISRQKVIKRQKQVIWFCWRNFLSIFRISAHSNWLCGFLNAYIYLMHI